MTFEIAREMTKMSRVVASLLCEANCTDLDPKENLQVIAEKFSNITEEPTSIFALRMEAQCEKACRDVTSYVNNLLKSDLAMPDFWTTDMKLIVRDLTSPDTNFYMVDITKTPVNEKIKVLQKWMSLYGELLRNWHKLF